MDGTFYPKNDYRNYLEHHGVKGMRWGIRKKIEDRVAISRHARNRNKQIKQIIKDQYGGDRKAYRKDQIRKANKRSHVAILEKQYFSDDNFRKQINAQFKGTPYEIKNSNKKSFEMSTKERAQILTALHRAVDTGSVPNGSGPYNVPVYDMPVSLLDDKRRLR